MLDFKVMEFVKKVLQVLLEDHHFLIYTVILYEGSISNIIIM